MEDIYIPELNEIYDKLFEHVEKSPTFPLKMSEFKKDLRKFFFVPKNRSLREFFDGRGGSGRNKRKIELIRQLYLGFNIPFQIFHEDLRERHIFTENGLKGAYLREFVPLNYLGSTRRDEEEFANRYIKGVERFIKEAHKSIVVYDYLGKGRKYRPGIGLSHYEEAHGYIFRLMEKQIEEQPELQYTRFLALPFSDASLKVFENEDDASFGKNIKKTYFPQAIIETSAQTFEHLCRCFQFKFFNERISFSVVWIPTRLYQYGIIDNKYVVSEYYRYKRQGDFVPDLLFVEEVSDRRSNQLSDLLRIYRYETTTKLSNIDRAFQFDKASFLEAVKDARDFISEESQGIFVKWEVTKKESARGKKYQESKTEYEIWQTKATLMEKKIEKLLDIFKDDKYITDMFEGE